jgi:hypothetical protein
MSARVTHGRCKLCNRVVRWTPGLRLHEAACPLCGRALARTAASLMVAPAFLDRPPVRIGGTEAMRLRAARRA